jgi:DNA polymerase-3 subunit gamma/tau
VTILSRCLQFNLKRMPLPLIEQHLQHILEQEQIDFDPLSLRLLAHGADGSMRDALSLLDQAIAYGGGKLDSGEVQAMLGTVSRDRVMALLQALIDGDAGRLMAEVAALAEMTPDYPAALADLLALLHQIALAQYAPQAIDENLVEREALQALASQVAAEDVQLFYQIGLLGRRDLPLAPDARTGFEMALLRMLAFRPQPGQQRQPTAVAAASAAAPAPAPGPNTAAGSPPANRQNVAPAASAAPNPTAGSGQPFNGNWQGLIDACNIKGMVKQLAVNCTLEQHSGNDMQLVLNREFSQLLNPNLQNKLQDALSDFLGDRVKLNITLGQPSGETPAQTVARNVAEKQQAAEQSIEQDPVVQALKDNFDAVVVPNSVRPVE